MLFNKIGRDGSGKCNIYATGSENDRVHGVIYRIRPEHKHELDRVENVGNGYMDTYMVLEHAGQAYNCFTYIAQEEHISDNVSPYHWYKQLVLLGSRYHAFPDHYVSTIESILSVDDPDRSRTRQQESLIESITELN